MTDFIYSIPNLFLFLIIFSSLTILSLLCLYLVRKFVPLTFRYNENTSIGYVGATIGVVYAVLAGFIILYVMDNFEKASDIVTKEAIMTAKISRNASRLPEPIRSKIKTAMNNYVNTVIQIEWPNMSKDINSTEGEVILDNLLNELNTFSPTNHQQLLVIQTVFADVDELYNDRLQRFDMSKAALTGDLWILILISTLLTLLINCIVGMEFHLHVALQIVVTLMVSATLFLIIALDRPFLGYFSITPDAFKTNLQEMNNNH